MWIYSENLRSALCTDSTNRRKLKRKPDIMGALFVPQESPCMCPRN